MQYKEKLSKTYRFKKYNNFNYFIHLLNILLHYNKTFKYIFYIILYFFFLILKGNIPKKHNLKNKRST